jgi:hypothetical protein
MAKVKSNSLEEVSVRYEQASIASLMKLGAQIIAGKPAPTVSGSEMVWKIIRYPQLPWHVDGTSLEHSPKYKPLKGLSINELTGSGKLLQVDGIR